MKAFGEPIVTFLWMADYQRPGYDALVAYITEHASELTGRHEAFYDRGIRGRYFGGALKKFFASDYEYANMPSSFVDTDLSVFFISDLLAIETSLSS